MQSIAHASKTVFLWLWDHKFWTVFGVIATATTIITSIINAINHRIDGAIFLSLQKHGFMTAKEIAGRIGKSEKKTESRLWAMVADKKIQHFHGASPSDDREKHVFGLV